jgi:hydroxypyruvate reductase
MSTLTDIALSAIRSLAGGPRTQRVLESIVVSERSAGRWPPRAAWLFGAGKAAAAMAGGALAALDVPLAGGLVVTKDEKVTDESVTICRGGHPEPTESSIAAGRELMHQLGAIPVGDRVLFVLSGGASALIAVPRGASLDELRRRTREMLAGGVPIAEINRARGALSLTANGGLARACRATVDVLVLSDVLGDDLGVVGSGPFWDPAAEHVHHHLVGSHADLIDAAVTAAEGMGWRARRTAPTGADVDIVVADVMERLRGIADGEILVGGGEPTVTLPAHPGRGGRNQQLALSMARALHGGPPRAFVALASDGDDGCTDAAGAVVDHSSWARMCLVGDPDRALAAADAHPMLAAIGALIRTGPTGTNVLDLHLAAVV